MLKTTLQQSTRLFALFVVFCILLAPGVGSAQDAGEQQPQVANEAGDAIEAIEEQRVLKAVAGEDTTIQVGRQILFDGSASTNSNDSELQYLWDFGDGFTATGVDPAHTYDRPGQYTVTLRVSNNEDTSQDQLTVLAFQDLIVLISDGSLSDDKLDAYRFNAGREGILLLVVEYASSEPTYVIEEELASLLIAETDNVAKADIIIDGTDGSVGLNVLSKFAQEVEDLEKLNMPTKGVIALKSPSSSLARIAQSTYNILRPEYILIATDAALPTVWATKQSDKFLQEIQASEVDVRVLGAHSERSVDDFRVWNFMSYGIDWMVNQGVPVNTITLILMLPIIALIVTLARQVIGVKAFGIYTPSIITLAFLATGLYYGLVIFLVVLVSGSITRVILRKFRLLFLPRMAIVLSVVALAVLALLAVSAWFGQQALFAVSIFPILIMITLVEKFVAAQIEKGVWEASKLSFETLIISVIGFFILSWDPLRDFILAYPEVTLLTIVFNVILGKWTSLRLTEYYRFRDIRRYLKE